MVLFLVVYFIGLANSFNLKTCIQPLALLLLSLSLETYNFSNHQNQTVLAGPVYLTNPVGRSFVVYFLHKSPQKYLYTHKKILQKGK